MTKHSSPSFQDRLRDLREALKPAGDAECKNLIQRICIMPRGEITRVFNSLYRGFVMMLQRTASIWLTQLPKLQSDLTVLCEFTPICDAIVVADNCPLSKVYITHIAKKMETNCRSKTGPISAMKRSENIELLRRHGS